MSMRVVRVIAFLVAMLAMPVAAASTGAAFAPASDLELVDHGTMIVTGGWADRRETFEILRRADGGRTIVSTITAADGGYRVQGRWDYDAEERALSAHGLGQHDGEAVTIDILAAPPAGTLRFEGADGGVQTFHAPCKPRCLIDMTPSALPMFTMTRLYDYDRGGSQAFPWIGYGLTRNMRLLDGTVDLRFVKDLTLEGPAGETLRLRHFVWDEDLIEDVSGKRFKMHANFWIDAAHRPIKFTIGSKVSGIREGYEAIDAQLVAQ